MSGKAARRERKRAIPKDLINEKKERVSVLQKSRDEKIRDHLRGIEDATAEFNKRKTLVEADLEEVAAKRKRALA